MSAGDPRQAGPHRAAGLALCVLAGASCAASSGSIGALLAQANADGRVTVREAPAGYPAARAGLVPGDEVLLIDGRDVRRMSPDAIHRALRGEIGTSVRLTVLRAGAIERLAVSRASLEPPPKP